MVDYTEEYKALVEQAAGIYDKLIQVYLPDSTIENDWADITIAETGNYYRGLQERLIYSRKVTAEDASTFIVSAGHYLDSHWADYKELPLVSFEKRKIVEELHSKLEGIISKVGQIYNILRV
jgi:hypothetical protein